MLLQAASEEQVETIIGLFLLSGLPHPKTINRLLQAANKVHRETTIGLSLLSGLPNLRTGYML